MDADRPRELSRHEVEVVDVTRHIDDLEREVLLHDPGLAERFRKIERRHARNDIAVFALLIVSIILFAVGLGTTSMLATGAGATAYLTSFVVDSRYHRALRRSMSDATASPRR